MQPKFVNLVPNALDPGFMFEKNRRGVYRVGIGPMWQQTGLVNKGGEKLWTKLFGYGQRGRYTWPGKTFEVNRADHPRKPNEFGSIATPKTLANPDTELPVLNTTERWKIYKFTEDAHPGHLYLVNFEILGRGEITFHSDDGDPGREVIMHNGEIGLAPIITNLEIGSRVNLTPEDGYVENAPKDMVTALPGQVTVIKATFDKLGKYVWHCHILSHEDDEMMRVM